MKKQIALIIISLLAAMPAAAHQNNNTRMCIRPQSFDSCFQKEYDFTWENQDFFWDVCFDICGNPCIDGDSSLPEVPQNPVLPEKPEKPQEPVLPEKPEKPQEPVLPEKPETPVLPEEPTLPEEPVVPENPDSGDIQPSLPSKSEITLLFELVNEAREKSGMKSLTYDTSLEECANVRAVEIKSLFSHTRPSGLSCFTVLDEYGYDYSYAGENIAYGQKDAEEVFTAWMNSQGHRENILSPSYTKIGMGLYGTGTLYWSQFFAG